MTHSIDQAIYDVASVLEVPVLIAALAALAAVLFELGAFVVELTRRRGRNFSMLSRRSAEARAALDAGDRSRVKEILSALAWSAATRQTLVAIADAAGEPVAEPQISKELADFDFDSQRRLSRTRLLVRVGPALGLMGTLIPLSPALEGLARGNITELSADLRVAFSVTVVGLLIGAIAFGLSLTRDRIYGQDLSDLEYVAAVLTADDALPVPPPDPKKPGRKRPRRKQPDAKQSDDKKPDTKDAAGKKSDDEKPDGKTPTEKSDDDASPTDKQPTGAVR